METIYPMDAPQMEKTAKNSCPPDILPRVRKKKTIAIVGPGNLGTALALSLDDAGYRVQEIIYRRGGRSVKRARSLARRVHARAETLESSRLEADLLWLCVGDRQIAAVAQGLTSRRDWHGKVVFHSSGALLSDELSSLRECGAAVASVHPLMTFVRGARAVLKDVPCAIEGDGRAVKAARSIVRDLGAQAFAIERGKKAAHHAWAAFTSPLIIAVLVTGEEVAQLAGQTTKEARRRMMPIVKQTIANYEKLGAAGAFSGPILRGDVETVRKHLAVLRKLPAARGAYVALAQSAMRHLPARNKQALRNVLRG
jgi:predicted short-subunit dehydrogenase-like oxidoreductase (DUF2520 family)